MPLGSTLSGEARAQSPADWLTGLQGQRPAEAADSDQSVETATVRMVARLTADGEEIADGLVWRVFWHPTGDAGRPTLIATKQEARPAFKLKVGDYVVNAALGRAHITRQISVKAETEAVEEFVLNAGGLRLKALVAGLEAPSTRAGPVVNSATTRSSGTRPVCTSSVSASGSAVSKPVTPNGAQSNSTCLRCAAWGAWSVAMASTVPSASAAMSASRSSRAASGGFIL